MRLKYNSKCYKVHKYEMIKEKGPNNKNNFLMVYLMHILAI